MWLAGDANGRRAIREAANRIDSVLANAPAQVGESRTGKDRIYFDSPWGITYRINDAEFRVRILHVWDIRNKS